MNGVRPTIGVFDSGIGGLTVLHSLVNEGIEADFFYLGDNGNAPYGNRSEEKIFSLVRTGVQSLEAMGVSCVVLACNTATAVAAERLRRTCKIPIVGMEPAVSLAAKEGKNVLVLATERTVTSVRVNQLCAKYAPCRFTLFGCPTLAAEIESGGGKISDERLNRILPRGAFDGIVLGCTHYVFIKEQISRFYRCKTFDGNEGVSRHVKRIFEGKSGKDQGLMTTSNHSKGTVDHLCIKTNKCSPNSAKITKFQQKNVIYFLGSWKTYNKLRYKQMFIFQNR